MASKHRTLVKLKSKETPTVYTTTKNKSNTAERLKLKKYDPILRKHVEFTEAK